jgi:argininosuccinate lyase
MPDRPTASPQTGGVGPSHQMWGGRFAAGPAAALDQLNRSLPVDHRLWPQDVRAARAWVGALGLAGVLDPQETKLLADGLDRVAERLAAGVARDAPDEDVHTLVERLLYEAVGPAAGKLNTGRSRNDQIATDLRLWVRETLVELDAGIAALGQTLCAQAADGVDLLMPGYTHGQRAQPVRWGYVLLAHAWPLTRDRARLAQVADRLSELPLGSGAVAGSGIPVDRERLARELEFARVAANALDATGDRDFVAECLFGLTLLATHISRLAGELATYASAEFGFVRLADEFCTGSSLLPQKRNPDVLELARAKAARTLADLVGLLGTLKGLPAGYSKDLQEDKAYLFDAVDTMAVVLPAVRRAVATLRPVRERMRAALDPSLLATDLADALVLQGVPFREAHGLVGRLVKEAEVLGSPVSAVPGARAAAIHPAFPDLLASVGDWEASVERRATAGGSSREAVDRQLQALQVLFSRPAAAGA